MSRDWDRLGAAIRTAREAQHMKQIDLAKRAGVSESTVQNFEAGMSRSRMPATLPAIERALNWEAGSASAVLAGGDPTQAESVPLPSLEEQEAARPALPLRIVQELTDGPLLDTKVLNLSDEDSEARMIVVVKGKQDASPEQIRQALLLWERTEAKLRNLEADQDDASSIEEA